MKYYLLIFLVLSVLIAGIFLANKVIIVQIVIPLDLLPYYEWLVSFPGFDPITIPPTPENIPIFDTKEL